MKNSTLTPSFVTAINEMDALNYKAYDTHAFSAGYFKGMMCEMFKYIPIAHQESFLRQIVEHNEFAAIADANMV